MVLAGVLVSCFVTNKRLKLSKNYKTLEPIALEVKKDLGNMAVLGIYRPPRTMCGDYRLILENELSDVCYQLGLSLKQL